MSPVFTETEPAPEAARPPAITPGSCCSGDVPAQSSCCRSDSGEREPGDLTWFRVALALVIAGQGMVFGLGYNNAVRAGEGPAYGSGVYWLLHGGLFLSALVVIALLGVPLLRSAFGSLRQGRVTVDSLFLLTASGALAASIVSTLRGEGSVYYEVVGVVLAIYTVGRKVGARTRGHALAAANEWRENFEWAQIETPGGNRRRVPVTEVGPEAVAVVLPGEPVTVDGRIIEGRGHVQETVMTGELVPTEKRPGDAVFAGSYSEDARFRIRPTGAAGERTIDRILQAVETAVARPSRFQTQADTLIRWFLPFVVTVSATTFLFWWLLMGQPWVEALFNAMAVLLVACPCALGLATPIAIWTGLLTLSRRGLVSRDGQLLDGLAQAEEWYFDKTGTLSSGHPVVESLEVLDPQLDPAWLRRAVASLEAGNSHPLARALETLAPERVPVEAVRILPGQGIEGRVEGKHLRIGSPAWLGNGKVEAAVSRVVLVALGEEVVARVRLSEAIDADAASSLERLRALGVRVRIVSGDPAPAHRRIGGVEVEGGQTPAQKLELVRAAARRTRGVVFVGDGMNDAAAIAAAPVGLAINGGAGLVSASAAGVLMGDRLAVLPWAVSFCRELQRRLRGNLLFALVYNLIGISLAASGNLHPVAAALLMLGSSAIVSWRAARVGEWAEQRIEKQ